MNLTHLLRRGLAAAMVALFLGGSAGEAAGLHGCPHHDPVGGHAVHADAPHGDDGGATACTCFGACHGSATVALPGGSDEPAVTPQAVLPDRFWATSIPAAHASPYLLPYATGPPTP